ncbi:hypothetical protein RF55_20113, partial [Lasius niger]
MGVPTGPNAHLYTATTDEHRIKKADLCAQQNIREARQCRRQKQIGVLEAAAAAEDSRLLYGPGIDNSV